MLLAVVGATATGKSALALSVATQIGGEIINCDSTSVYRGFDIGTDKVPPSERRGIPHHLIDVAEPTEVYSAARYSRDAGQVVREVTARDRLPVVVGGTGLYYRALTRGLFPGPGRDPVLRARLSRVARRRGVETLHRLLRRHDRESAQRIQPRDEKRLIRALEVYMLTGRSLTEHFASTRSPIADYVVVAVGLQLPGDELDARSVRSVDQQFAGGLLDGAAEIGFGNGLPFFAAGARRLAAAASALGWAVAPVCGFAAGAGLPEAAGLLSGLFAGLAPDLASGLGSAAA